MFLFQKRSDGAGEATLDTGDEWRARFGVAVQLLFAVAWLRLGERSPLAPLFGSSGSIRDVVTPEIARTTLGLASRGVALSAFATVVAIGALHVLVRSQQGRLRALTRAAIVVAIAVSGGLTAAEVGRDLSALAFPPPAPLWERVPLAPLRAMTTRHPRPARYDRVFLVIMESFGADALRELAAEEGPMGRIGRRAARFDSVLSPSNASHLCQPAVLVSRDLTQSDRHLYLPVPTPPQPLLGAAGWFRANGYRTVMVSSQDERWLGMDRIIAAQPWDTFVHSINTADGGALYRDACGVTKVLDSTTLARFMREVDAAPGPVFGYLNLQNTHFPYISEADQNPRDFAGLTCADFMEMPASRLGMVRARQRSALRESAARIEQLVARYPDALVVLVGDHGEEMVAGQRFGHAKSLMPLQFETFAWFLGPGVTPGARPLRASLLDVLPSLLELVAPGELASLPQGIFTGHSLWSMADPSRRIFFAVSSGAAPERTAVRGEVQLQVTEGLHRCVLWSAPERPIDGARCADLERALADWLSCQINFARGLTPVTQRSFSPCHALFEGLGPYRAR